MKLIRLTRTDLNMANQSTIFINPEKIVCISSDKGRLEIHMDSNENSCFFVSESIDDIINKIKTSMII